MQIDWDKVSRNIYIQELNDFKMYASDIIETYKHRIEQNKKALESQFALKNRGICDECDLEINKADFQFKRGLNNLRFYKVLSSLYQLLFSIWENQAYEYFYPVDDKTLKKIISNENEKEVKKVISKKDDKINELYLLINVLKHGEGQSYKKLKNIHKKYFEESFPDIMRGVFSGIILNISQSNLEEHCNNIIKLWESEK